MSKSTRFADTAEIIQSAVLGDNLVPRPDSSAIAIGAAPTPSAAGITIAHNQGTGSLAEGSVFGYKIVFVDSTGKESPASAAINVTVPAGNGTADNAITLGSLPTSTEYSQLAIYRTAPGGSEYFRLTTAP